MKKPQNALPSQTPINSAMPIVTQIRTKNRSTTNRTETIRVDKKPETLLILFNLNKSSLVSP